MEMERIDDDTIRVFMSLSELNSRGIEMLDLIKDRQQIEDFFYGILDEVDSDHLFTANKPVTFQVMPTEDGLEIFISRAQVPGLNDEGPADSESNQVSEQSVTEDPGEARPSDNRLQAIARNSLSQFFNQSRTSEPVKKEKDDKFFDDQGRHALVLQLAQFDDLIALSHELYLNGGTSDLYQYQGQYYVVLSFDQELVEEFDAQRQAHLALEYGKEAKIDVAVLSEYGKHLMADSALETTRYYF